jgi:hypothetical protein
VDRRAGRGSLLCVFDDYLIDLDAGIIVGVEASAVNKTAEVEATRAMLERVEAKLARNNAWVGSSRPPDREAAVRVDLRLNGS